MNYITLIIYFILMFLIILFNLNHMYLFFAVVGLYLLLVSTHGSLTTQYQQDTKIHQPDRAILVGNAHEAGAVLPEIS